LGEEYFVVTSGDRYDEIIAAIIKAVDRKEATENLTNIFLTTTIGEYSKPGRKTDSYIRA